MGGIRRGDNKFSDAVLGNGQYWEQEFYEGGPKIMISFRIGHILLVYCDSWIGN